MTRVARRALAGYESPRPGEPAKPHREGAKRKERKPRAAANWPSFQTLCRLVSYDRSALDYLTTHSTAVLAGQKLRWGWDWRRAGPNMQWIKCAYLPQAELLRRARAKGHKS